MPVSENSYQKILGTSIAVLAVIASLGGIFGDVYRDIEWAAAQMKGQDAATIVLSAVLFALSFQRGVKSRLFQLGLFGYFAYTYTTYAFGPALNPLFIVYVALLSLSILVLITGFNRAARFTVIAESRWISITAGLYLILLSVMLGTIWTGDIIGNLRGAPLFENPTGEPFLVVYALDLGFVIPVSIYGAVNLFRKKRIGYIVTCFMLVKSATLGFALIAMTVALYLQGYGLEMFLVVLWGIIGAAGLLLSILFLRRLRVEP